MTGRTTRPPDPDDFPTLKDRNPAMWWVAVIVVAAMVLTTAIGLIGAILG